MAAVKKRLAIQIVQAVKDVCGHDINFIDPSGMIYTSTDETRIGQFHEIGREAARRGETIAVERDDAYDGTHRGVMLSLGVNNARVLDGVSLSLLFGGHVEAVRGVQMGGLCSMNSTLSGVAASAVNLATYRQDGVMLGLANAAFDQQNGVTVGLVNWAGRKAAGVQAGAFNQAVDGMDGLQLGLFNTAGELRGVQVGAMNRTSAPDSAGAQIGLVNGAHHAALQIGLLNLARHLEGVQIGLLNYAEDAAVPCLPILNARF